MTNKATSFGDYAMVLANLSQGDYYDRDTAEKALASVTVGKGAEEVREAAEAFRRVYPVKVEHTINKIRGRKYSNRGSAMHASRSAGNNADEYVVKRLRMAVDAFYPLHPVEKTKPAEPEEAPAPTNKSVWGTVAMMVILKDHYNWLDNKPVDVYCQRLCMENCIIRNADLRGARFCKSNIANVTFDGCDLDQADFRDADLVQVRFYNCSTVDTLGLVPGAIRIVDRVISSNTRYTVDTATRQVVDRQPEPPVPPPWQPAETGITVREDDPCYKEAVLKLQSDMDNHCVQVETGGLDLGWYREAINHRMSLSSHENEELKFDTGLSSLQYQFLAELALSHRGKDKPSPQELHSLDELLCASFHFELPVSLDEQVGVYEELGEMDGLYVNRLKKLLWVVVRRHYAGLEAK